MLENLYTTKMSNHKKSLQNRFSKIRSKNGKLSRIAAFVVFGILLMVLLLTTIILAATAPADYEMTDHKLDEYLTKQIGSMMADLDYAAPDRVVFHYLNGFFVYNPQSDIIEQKIDLSALNIAPHQQGSHGLQVVIDDAGKFAYLSSYGPENEIKDFDEYIINLGTGQITKGSMPENTQAFMKFKETVGVFPEPFGWYSDRCVLNEGHNYYITITESEIVSLQLVDQDRTNNLESYTYIFKEHYQSPARKRANIIDGMLPADVSYPIGGELSWNVDRETVLELFQLVDAKFSTSNSERYDAVLYQIQKGDVITPYLFIFDSATGELIGHHVFWDNKNFAEAVKILNGGKSQLYDRTAETLNSAFRRTYGNTYNIQNLTISNWQERKNEATFHLNLSYLYYNRDPDKLEYIQEAKKTSEESYRTLYDDYLSLHQGNYFLKVVAEGKELHIYSNSAPKGEEWEPLDIYYVNPNEPEVES